MRERSPGYPAIDLAEAIERTRKLLRFHKSDKIDAKTAFETWGIKYGYGSQVVASLGYYGLIESGKVDGTTQYWVSDLALRIIRDERSDSSERIAAIREAALKPKVFGELFGGPGGDASDEDLRSYLKLKSGFTEDGALTVVRTFRKVLVYASLVGVAPGMPVREEASPEQRRSQMEGPVTVMPSKTLELPIRIGAETSSYAFKFPTQITWKDWEKMRDNLDRIMKEVVVDGSEKQE